MHTPGVQGSRAKSEGQGERQPQPQPMGGPPYGMPGECHQRGLCVRDSRSTPPPPPTPMSERCGDRGCGACSAHYKLSNLQARVTPTYDGNPLEGGDALGNGTQVVHKGASAVLHVVDRSNDGSDGRNKVLVTREGAQGGWWSMGQCQALTTTTKTHVTLSRAARQALRAQQQLSRTGFLVAGSRGSSIAGTHHVRP